MEWKKYIFDIFQTRNNGLGFGSGWMEYIRKKLSCAAVSFEAGTRCCRNRKTENIGLKALDIRRPQYWSVQE